MPGKRWNDCEHLPHSTEQTELTRERGAGAGRDWNAGIKGEESSRIPFEIHQLERDRYREIQLVDEDPTGSLVDRDATYRFGVREHCAC